MARRVALVDGQERLWAEDALSDGRSASTQFSINSLAKSEVSVGIAGSFSPCRTNNKMRSIRAARSITSHRLAC